MREYDVSERMRGTLPGRASGTQPQGGGGPEGRGSSSGWWGGEAQLASTDLILRFLAGWGLMVGEEEREGGRRCSDVLRVAFVQV